VGAGYVLISCREEGESIRVEASLASAGVDSRRWYGDDLHRHAYFSQLCRDPLTVTDELASRLLGLPLAQDLPEAAVWRVVDALDRAPR
jgi:dTDP-4-amino-4,6-dideoxygalactose transaminase